MEERRYWNVAVPRPIDDLWTYYSDESSDLSGYRVLVPFGNKDGQLAGVVVSENLDVETLDSKRIKCISEVIDVRPAFSGSMLKLMQWMSNYYQCPIGETFKVAIPSGISPKTVVRIIPNRTNIDLEQIRNPKHYKLLSFLLANVSEYSIDYLERYLQIANLQPHINYLLERNLIAVEQENTRPRAKFVKGVVLDSRLLTEGSYRKEVLDVLDKKAPSQSSLLAFVALHQVRTGKPVLVSEIGKVVSSHNSVIKALEKKELLTVVEIEEDRNKKGQENGKLASRNEAKLRLTAEQEHCIEEIVGSIGEGVFDTYLLHGITGSGKTLVYIHSIERVLALGKSALVLVPEISLTPQLIDRFNIVFPEQIAVFHSRLSDGERYDAWRSVLSGRTKIVLGARSALFAPLQDLGLIIVDEEHEPSYKQDSSIPYYHCRDAAIMRAKLENATIVLGSATPSVETYYNAMSGKYKLLAIKERADNARLPSIQMIDMLDASKQGQVVGDFSHALVDKIKDRVSKREGIILFQNKRGFASYLRCMDCGHIPICEHCSVTLTYHQASNELRCHYCGYSRKVFSTCEVCGKVGMQRVGSGTQRVEEQLSGILSDEGVNCKIARLDLDSTRKKGEHRAILQDFVDGKTDILLGTQMVAKGLDFDRVTLVGVINADIQLLLPDFRSGERTFQLLSQVSGRAGRSGNKYGEVIIQTTQCKNYAIEAVMANNFGKYYEKEVKIREGAAFPPFVRFCVIEFGSIKEEQARVNAERFYGIMHQLVLNSDVIYRQAVLYYPPQAAIIAKINDKYRFHLSVKSVKRYDLQGIYLHTLLTKAHSIYKQKYALGSVSVRIDIDSYIGY
jgi:primosomal protein N' (replication factor Y)